MKRNVAKCKDMIVDGGGTYCKRLPVNDQDYPHEYWRTFCFGRSDSVSCDMSKDCYRKRYQVEALGKSNT